VEGGGGGEVRWKQVEGRGRGWKVEGGKVEVEVEVEYMETDTRLRQPATASQPETARRAAREFTETPGLKTSLQKRPLRG